MKKIFHLYHLQQLQSHCPPNHCARVVCGQWFHTKYIVKTQFVAHVLVTDWQDSQGMLLLNFHNACARGDENPHITVTSRHKHRFSISAWEGILAYQSLGPVVLPDRLTGSLHP
jgi:hypothetical protein